MAHNLILVQPPLSKYNPDFQLQFWLLPALYCIFADIILCWGPTAGAQGLIGKNLTLQRHAGRCIERRTAITLSALTSLKAKLCKDLSYIEGRFLPQRIILVASQTSSLLSPGKKFCGEQHLTDHKKGRKVPGRTSPSGVESAWTARLKNTWFRGLWATHT